MKTENGNWKQNGNAPCTKLHFVLLVLVVYLCITPPFLDVKHVLAY